MPILSERLRPAAGSVLTSGTTSDGTAMPGGTTTRIGARFASLAVSITDASIVRSPMRASCFGDPNRVEAPAASTTAATRIGSSIGPF